MLVIKRILLTALALLLVGCSQKTYTIKLVKDSESILPLPVAAEQLRFAGQDDNKLWFLQFEKSRAVNYWSYDLKSGIFDDVSFTDPTKLLNVKSHENMYVYTAYEEDASGLTKYRVLAYDGIKEILLLEGLTNDYYRLPPIRVKDGKFYIMANVAVLNEACDEIINHEWALYQYSDGELITLDAWHSLERGVIPFNEVRIQDNGIFYRKIRGIDDQYKVYLSSIINGRLKEREALIDTRTVEKPIMIQNHLYLQERIIERKSMECNFRQYNVENDSNKLMKYDLGLCFYLLYSINDTHMLGILDSAYYILRIDGDSVVHEKYSLYELMGNVYDYTTVDAIFYDNSIYFINCDTMSMVKMAIQYVEVKRDS